MRVCLILFNFIGEDESVLHSIMPQLLNSEEISLSIVDTTTQNTPTYALKQTKADEILTKYETEETLQLSNMQIQRLLIHQQLKYFDMKTKRMQEETAKVNLMESKQRQVDEMISMYKECKEPKVKRKKLKAECDATDDDSGKGSSSGRDEHSCFGEFIASKIRKLKSHRLRTLAQFKINNLLSEIELEDQICSQSAH